MKEPALLKRGNAPPKTHSRVATLVRAAPLRGLLAISIAATAVHAQSPGDVLRSLLSLFPVANPSRFVETYNINDAAIDRTGLSFQSLGTNGRSCSSCHRFAEAWPVSAGEVQFRFLATQGLDPIFRTNDGSNCDHNIDTSTVAGRRAAYSLLLDPGLIRIALGVPANPEFTVVSVQNHIAATTLQRSRCIAVHCPPQT